MAAFESINHKVSKDETVGTHKTKKKEKPRKIKYFFFNFIFA